MRLLSVGNVYPPHDLGGGYERVWTGANEHLRSLGHELRVLCSDHRSPTAGEELDPDVHRELRWYWRDHAFPRRSFAASASLERHNKRVIETQLEEFDPELVLWWSMGGLSMGLLETVRRRGLPALAFVHDDWLDYGRRVDAWQRRGSRLPPPLARALEAGVGVPVDCDFDRAARYLFVSRSTRDRAAAAGVQPGDADILHSGIDSALLERPATNGGEWGWRLLCVGRVDERKGTATAIDALPLLPAEATLTVVGGGDPSTVAGLQDRARRLGVAERVNFAGPCGPGEVIDHYDACDAVAFPVVWEEPWGLVPLEAMARSRPVLATGRGGSAEYLRDGENAVLFEAEDAAALAAGARRLAGDGSLRVRLLAAGRRTAAQHSEDGFNDGVAREVDAAPSRLGGTAPA